MAKKRKAEKRKPAKRKPGRPRKLSDQQRRAKLLKHLKETGSRGRAATLAGIVYNTLLAEMQHDQDFAAEVVAVEQQALDELEEVAHKGAKKDPALALRILERKRHKSWGKTQQVNHGGQVGVTVDTAEVRQELLNDSGYLEYLRQSAIESDGHSSSVCENGKPGKVANGSPSRPG